MTSEERLREIARQLESEKIQLARALGYMFRETHDMAKMLNGDGEKSEQFLKQFVDRFGDMCGNALSLHVQIEEYDRDLYQEVMFYMGPVDAEEPSA